MAFSPGFDLVKAAEALLEDAKKLQFGPSCDVGTQNELRAKIAGAGKKIAFEAALPVDVVKAEWMVITDVAVWHLFLNWKAFDLIPLNGSITFSELAKALDAQEQLIARLCSTLLVTGKLAPGPTPDSVSHSRVSPLYMTSSPISAFALVAVGNGMKPFSHWPEYFAKYGRREPVGQTHTPFGFGWDHPELPPWEVKALYPDYATAFTRSMKSREIFGGDMPIVGKTALYDMAWIGQVAQKRPKNEPLLVDVGGGLGQLLKEILENVDSVQPGQLVLQDRKEVIEEAKQAGDEVMRGVVMMEHDFHDEQPVKGALVYVLRRILLDYSDKLAIHILRQLAAALPENNPDARIIIMEPRLLDTLQTDNRMVDTTMLNLGGKLRNHKLYTEIAAAAGLKVVRFRIREGLPTCAVECVRA
ncbi:Demethylsterigmatocystin 6-O-methyltransferase [Podospora australis]|uniref:Demethylsterigmatocystin 6-O-methyltransferase n=1 Tax=Podospora australis TaxID=1536484 RepID=A0AAN6WJ12_9PEZI|nr:Demethylsterigmatocystin 6-O-methyltransferase [Podospora australis]